MKENQLCPLEHFQTPSWLRFLVLLVAFIMAGSSLPILVHGQGQLNVIGIDWPEHCISPADRDHTERAIRDYILRFGPLSRLDASTPEKFSFYPTAGTLYGDLLTVNFVDLDPSAGLLDWDCTNFTYNGHDATDVAIRCFGEQAIGVPIYAALDGTVIAVHDGEDDMSTGCPGPPYPVANYVIIDHGNGRHCRYYHFKKNSILVSVSQQVRAGEHIGDVGSSGCSTHPHIHFSTYDNDGTTLVEPYAGTCRPGDSEWLNQTPIRRDLYLYDFNVTDQDLSTHPGPAYDFPRTGTFVLGTRMIYNWCQVVNLPDSTTWRHRYKAPDGSVHFDSGTQSFGGNPFYRWAWLWFYDEVNLDTLGTWHIVFDIGGEILVEAPFEVVASVNDITNRAPYSINVQIEPQSPTVNDVLICRVNTDILLDDPDYDIVRYHYVWEVDGQIVRDITTAAYSDVIPHSTASPSSVVICTVTPMDETDSGPPASDSVTLMAPIPTLSHWGLVIATVLLLAIGIIYFRRRRTA